MKKIITCLLVGVVMLSMVGCSKKEISPYDGKEKINQFYFDIPEEVQKTEKKSGTLESGMDWESIEYTLNGMILTITDYKGRNIDKGLIYRENLEEREIHGIIYNYSEKKLDDTYISSHYYIQKEENVYDVSIVYKDNEENRQAINAFLDTVVLQ